MKRHGFTIVAGLFVAASLASIDPPKTMSRAEPAATNPAAGNEVRSVDLDDAKENAVIWRVPTGSYTGSLVVADDDVFVGSNNPADLRTVDGKDKALLLCLSATTGRERWRVEHARLPHRSNDIPGSPIVSRPAIDGDRVYYFSNRGELCCVNRDDGKMVWALDMPRDLGVYKRDVNDAGMLAPSPIVVGDLVYCVTGNGGDFGEHGWYVPRPDAPSFVAVDKKKGTLVWSRNDPGKSIAYGQWSTPAFADVGGVREILFPGGDGFLYACEPLKGELLWKLNCTDPRHAASPDFIVAPPLVDGDTAYVCLNRDYEQSGAPRLLHAIDLRTHTIRWTFSDPRFDGTLGPMVLSNGILYAAGIRGLVVAIDTSNGKLVWSLDTTDVSCGGVCMEGDHLFIAGEEALHLLSIHDRRERANASLSGDSAEVTPVMSKGVLYLATRQQVMSLRLKELSEMK